MLRRSETEWIPRSARDPSRDQCVCHCYHCRPAHTTGLKCSRCGFMPAEEPAQLLTDATVLLATALLAGADDMDLAAVQEDACWFAETRAVPDPPIA